MSSKPASFEPLSISPDVDLDLDADATGSAASRSARLRQRMSKFGASTRNVFTSDRTKPPSPRRMNTHFPAPGAFSSAALRA